MVRGGGREMITMFKWQRKHIIGMAHVEYSYSHSPELKAEHTELYDMWLRNEGRFEYEKMVGYWRVYYVGNPVFDLVEN